MLKYRFTQEIRDELLDINYKDISESFILSNKELFTNPISDSYIANLKNSKIR